MVNGVTPPPIVYCFGQHYLVEVVLATALFWRSSDEAASQAEEVLEQIDQCIEARKADPDARFTYMVRSSTMESLRTEMKLAEGNVRNPLFVRPSVYAVRIVNNARKHIEPEPKKKEAPSNGRTDAPGELA